ncbi:hypothetical protein QCA50_002256 [Cerrena zonata]|uniref:Uncharacterized protein n=1 Tax=Cerrena zonata TaxID=2478898 RepID=A0AAW0GR03_9APHY
MPSVTLSVGHYGYPFLQQNTHWSFLLAHPKGGAIAYQVGGSPQSYEFRQPAVVEPRKAATFMGKVDVGTIELSNQTKLEDVLRQIPVVRGSEKWNCQTWVVEGLKALREKGFEVEVPSQEELSARLGKAKKYG